MITLANQYFWKYVFGNIFVHVTDFQSETHRRLIFVFFQTYTIHTWICTYTLEIIIVHFP
jgi:hypothetical protein